MNPLFILGLINVGLAVYWAKHSASLNTFPGLLAFFCGFVGALALISFAWERRVIVGLYLKAFAAMFALFFVGVSSGKVVKTVKIVWGLWRAHRSLHKIMRSNPAAPANREALRNIARQWNIDFNEDDTDELLREQIRRSMILTFNNRPISGTTQNK